VLCCCSRPPHAVAKSEWRQLWGQGFQSTTSSTKFHNGALPSSKDSRTSCYSIVRELPRQNRTQCTPEAETADQPTQKADQPFVEASPSFRNCRPLGGMENGAQSSFWSCCLLHTHLLTSSLHKEYNPQCATSHPICQWPRKLDACRPKESMISSSHRHLGRGWSSDTAGGTGFSCCLPRC
jgi:hypothetical protein